MDPVPELIDFENFESTGYRNSDLSLGSQKIDQSVNEADLTLFSQRSKSILIKKSKKNYRSPESGGAGDYSYRLFNT